MLQAKAFIGNEPFVVMLGDDLMKDDIPLTQQLMMDYEETQASAVAVMRVQKMKHLNTELLILKQIAKRVVAE